ncbi:SDR family oxidoreductase [Streptomyces sp. NPDC006356]
MSGTRVVIITGAGSGIGASTARRLTAAGHYVIASGRRPEPLRKIAAETGTHPVAGDAATPRGAQSLVDAALDRFGRLDGLVLNTAAMSPGTVGDTVGADFGQGREVGDLMLRVRQTGHHGCPRLGLKPLSETDTRGVTARWMAVRLIQG